ncbi:MAG TPA: SpoIIE family protein phosphatase, partial [Thermoanaerobaculia bacterium]
EKFHEQMQKTNDQQHEREMVIERRREAALAQRQATRVVTVRSLSPEQRLELKSKEKQAGLLFGHRFNVSLHSDGKVVGQIRAQLSTDEVIKRVLGAQNDDTAEIPFAVDRENNVYTRNTTDRATLDRLGIIDALKSKKPLPHLPNWVVAMSFHKESGLHIGAARPVGENLEELQKTAARNFGLGIGVIALAMIGILPVASHFTRDVEVVTEGAQRIAQGDLMTRLPVRSKNEFGQLASAFNQMAEDLSLQQEKLVEQERARREQDIQQRVLAIEYERKTVELEDARRFQLSMLPKHVPAHDRYDVAVLTQTATEVGGDYYDFHVSRDGALSVTIGDATGHGAKAGTMVTVVKTLFAGYNSSTEPSAFLGDAAEKIKRMDLGRMAMALSLARFNRQKLTVASAGMPPVLVHRVAEDRVDEISLGATPLGTLGVDYLQTDVNVSPGDTVLLMSDGFPELENKDGQQLGYQNATQAFASAAKAADADAVIADLQQAAKRWHGDQPPNDDVTFVVVRCRA